jgi:hypothetical protein
MKKMILIVMIVLITLAICFTGCFIRKSNLKEVELGERYDSDKILVSEEGSIEHRNRLTEMFEKYSKTASEVQFVIHEETAIAIAEAVMRELYPDDNFGMGNLPPYFRSSYYKAENCWEVCLLKNGLDPSLSYSELIQAEAMYVYIDVNTGAVKAIIPATEFSIHNPANSSN